MSEETVDGPRGLYEKLKSDDDRWELWAKLGVGLLGLQAVTYVVAFARLGEPSVLAHSVGISLLGILTMPLMFWGLIRTIFRPPVWRLSRTVAFLSLLVAGYFGKVTLFTAPVSTSDWTAAQEYRLPFDGPWVTLAGGDDRTYNYHATTMAHRWGYDFAPVIDGNRYEGDGSELEDHHCYGTAVLAPVDGRVISVLGSEKDHPPGEYDPNHILGNHVILRVGSGEYLFMAHFRQGSVQVGTGDEVRAGEEIAQCGNSGRSSTPHLHIHLQNSRDFPLAESLPLRFSDYLADGEAVEVGMPQGSKNYEAADGQVVENRIGWAQWLDEEDESGDLEDGPSAGTEDRDSVAEAGRLVASQVADSARRLFEGDGP